MEIYILRVFVIFLHLLYKNQDIGQAQPVLYDYNNKKKIDSMGNLMTHVGYPYKIRIENISDFNSQKIINTFYTEGTSVIRKKILSDMSKNSEPYDSDYSIMFEDVDLRWRLWLQGFRVVVILDSFCYHLRGLTRGSGKLRSNAIFLNTRNRLMTLLKNSKALDLIKFFSVSLFLETSKAFILLRYNPCHAKATFRGVFWIISHIPSILKKRKSSRIRNFKLMPDEIFVKTNILQLRREFNRQYGIG